MSDRKIACPMDPIDPSDHLTFAILAIPLASRLYCLALCNYVISPSVKYLFDRKIACPMDPSDHLTFAILANPLASRLYCLALCNYIISPSVKYLSVCKIACPIDPIDPSDHLTFAMLANPLASRLYYLALCNYVIYSSLIPFVFNRIRQFTIGKPCPMDPLDIRHEQLKNRHLEKT